LSFIAKRMNLMQSVIRLQRLAMIMQHNDHRHTASYSKDLASLEAKRGWYTEWHTRTAEVKF